MRENETTLQYVKRMVYSKIDGSYTGDYSAWMKEVFGKEYEDTNARKAFYGIKMFVLELDDDLDALHQDLSEDISDASIKQRLDDLMERELQIDKKRIKLADETAYLNRLKKDAARSETIGEYAATAARAVAAVAPLLTTPSAATQQDGNAAILLLSDWHYGLVTDNQINFYNPEVARERASRLLKEVAGDIKLFNLSELVVANLGDMISGIIHNNIRLENRIDVITQVIEVSEILAELLSELSQHTSVSYYSVVDNHGRVSPNKDDSLSRENFSRMIDYFLTERFRGTGVQIHQGSDEEIMQFTVNGFTVVGVHGHNDKPGKAINNLSSMLHRDFDLCIMAHRHSPASSEQNEDTVVCNGCFGGTDEYAKHLRLTSRPSQTLIVVSNDNVCKYMHKILL